MSVQRIRKGCSAAAVAAALALLFAAAAFLYWPVFFDADFTVPVEGMIIDEVTGTPVSKVLVTCEWSYFSHVAFDTSTWGEVNRTVTGADGRFRIPRWKVTKPMSSFSTQTLFVRHPMYDPRQILVATARPEPGPTLNEKPPQPPQDPEAIVYPAGTRAEGALALEVKIMKLEDRYSRPEDNAALSIVLAGIKPDFFLFMRDQFSISYDLKDLLDYWSRLAQRFPSGTLHNGAQRTRREIGLLKTRFESILRSYP